MLLAGVVNPAAGTISDFEVKTTGDPIYVNAPPYTIGANASPGVVVTVNPSTTGIPRHLHDFQRRGHRSADWAASSTLELEAPTGTTFSTVAGYFSIVDTTNSAGSGTVSGLERRCD